MQEAPEGLERVLKTKFSFLLERTDHLGEQSPHLYWRRLKMAMIIFPHKSNPQNSNGTRYLALHNFLVFSASFLWPTG